MKPVDIPELRGPGRLLIWRCPEVKRGRLTEGDARCLEQAGVDLVICLLEDEELERYGESLSQQRRALQRSGLPMISWPIEDFGAPEVEQMRTWLGTLRRHLDAGKAVLVHCMAGLGRAGTVAACALVDQGMEAEAAMALVRWVRPGAIQAEVQEGLIRGLAQTRPKAPHEETSTP